MNIRGSMTVTPLSAATIQNHIECMRLLLNAGADVNQADNERFTPVMEAAIHNHPECIKLLLQK